MNRRQTKKAFSLRAVESTDGRTVKRYRIEYWPERVRLNFVRCSRRVIVEADARMMADITRHAPLSPEDQARHDNTEYPSEKWLADYEQFQKA